VKLYLFDDQVADGWHPFALTRPCGELLFGTMLLRERLERFAGRETSATLSRGWLAPYAEAGAPPVQPRDSTLAGEDRLFLLTRAVPENAARFEAPAGGPVLLRVGGEIAGCFLPADHADPGAQWLLHPESPLPSDGPVREIEVAGELLPAVWSLVERNRRRLAVDLEENAETLPVSLPAGVHRLGDGNLSLAADVALEPGVVLDVREGPIRLEAGVEVRAGCRLEGPLYAGAGCRLLGGPVSALAAGPGCHLRGEIEESVVLGFTNKAHDGYLGHSYLGRWVNLGAMTTNSNLKNNYGPVRLGGPRGDVETGLLKLGCLVGDHVKTAIGTLVNTGTVVGAGSNLFGGGHPTKWVEPFSWGGGPSSKAYSRDAFLHTAAVAMGRRGVECDEATRAWLAACWDAARGG
jgi:UDP-N-acetylglucosamine diphosphorylase/glucosamine-1-phosphate N-acetyltransferase